MLPEVLRDRTSARLYLVRHGQSTWNAERRTQGQTVHPPLTEAGREQAGRAARAIADDLAGHSPAVLVASDLVRARETAAVIGAHLGLAAVHDPRLREQAVGSLEGLTYDDAYSAAADVDWADPDAPVCGGESARAVYDRMAAALAELCGTVAVVVSHGDALRFALGGLAGHGAGDCPWLEVPSGAVFAVDAAGTRLITPAPAPPA